MPFDYGISFCDFPPRTLPKDIIPGIVDLLLLLGLILSMAIPDKIRVCNRRTFNEDGCRIEIFLVPMLKLLVTSAAFISKFLN